MSTPLMRFNMAMVAYLVLKRAQTEATRKNTTHKVVKNGGRRYQFFSLFLTNVLLHSTNNSTSTTYVST